MILLLLLMLDMLKLQYCRLHRSKLFSQLINVWIDKIGHSRRISSTFFSTYDQESLRWVFFLPLNPKLLVKSEY